MKHPSDDIPTILDYMKKIYAALTSRTIWVVAALVLMAELPVLQEVVSPLVYKAVMIALGVLATYFKLNPSQPYGEDIN